MPGFTLLVSERRTHADASIQQVLCEDAFFSWELKTFRVLFRMFANNLIICSVNDPELAQNSSFSAVVQGGLQ